MKQFTLHNKRLRKDIRRILVGRAGAKLTLQILDFAEQEGLRHQELTSILSDMLHRRVSRWAEATKD